MEGKKIKGCTRNINNQKFERIVKRSLFKNMESFISGTLKQLQSLCRVTLDTETSEASYFGLRTKRT